MRESFTGLHSIKEFIIEGERFIKAHPANYAVVAVDLSNFKYLNDMYGMEQGDEAIQLMANELFKHNSSCVMACHIVGDQFRALLDIEDRTLNDEIDKISQMNLALEATLEQMFPKVYLHVYTGLYRIDEEEISSDDFSLRIAVDKAHFAKKQAKGHFESNCIVYRDDKYKDFSKQMEVVKIFENACVNDGVKAFFQPKIDAGKKQLIGAEALCRLVDEEGKIVPPGAFIPILENNGMLGKLDALMLEKTFSHMREWMDAGKEMIPISINLSRVDFYNENLVEQIVRLQKQYEIPAEYIELEVTESTFIQDMNNVVASVQALRNQGFHISVDDFGSGYSSLSLLTTMPADIIKLDGSFARQSIKSEKGIDIVRSVIEMLKKIDFDIICEGVETLEEEKLIVSLGCSKIQGYLYDKPLSKKAFEVKYLSKA